MIRTFTFTEYNKRLGTYAVNSMSEKIKVFFNSADIVVYGMPVGCSDVLYSVRGFLGSYDNLTFVELEQLLFGWSLGI